MLDNLETLLTASGDSRDPLWGDLVEALLAHKGRRTCAHLPRRPAAWTATPPARGGRPHAVLAESALLAHELPRLRRLFDDADGLALLPRHLSAW